MVLRHRFATALAVGAAAVVLFASGAAAHTLYATESAFYNPSNWPYYECATNKAGIADTRDGKSFVYAYHHSPTCVTANARPGGGLYSYFDMFVSSGGTYVACYMGAAAYNATTASNFGVGGVVCGGLSSPRAYYTVGFTGYWDDLSACGGCWRTGASISPQHLF